MEKRYYQPSLLWSIARDWYIDQANSGPRYHLSAPQEYGPHDLTLYVYRTDETGAYMLSGPKMYWQDDPMTGDHFGNIDQGALADNADTLGEVVIWDRRLRKTEVVGATFDAAISRIRGNKIGRPALAPGEKSIQIQFRLPESDAAKLGDDPNDRAREIVKEWLSKQNA